MAGNAHDVGVGRHHHYVQHSARQDATVSRELRARGALRWLFARTGSFTPLWTPRISA